MTEDKPSVIAAGLIKQLDSQDPAIVGKVLYKLEKVAGIKDLPAIVMAMSKADNQKLLQEYVHFLSGVHVSQAPAVMVELIANPVYAKIRAELVRACWESNLDYSPHLLLFARLFIAGDYALALEAFSVIENTVQERPVNKKILAEILILIKNNQPDQPEAMQKLGDELIKILEPFVSDH